AREQLVSRRCERQQPAALVVRIDGHLDQAAALERLERGGERGAIHGEHGRHRGHARRRWAVERRQQRELLVGEIERAKDLVETAGGGGGRGPAPAGTAAARHPGAGRVTWGGGGKGTGAWGVSPFRAGFLDMPQLC